MPRYTKAKVIPIRPIDAELTTYFNTKEDAEFVAASLPHETEVRKSLGMWIVMIHTLTVMEVRSDAHSNKISELYGRKKSLRT